MTFRNLLIIILLFFCFSSFSVEAQKKSTSKHSKTKQKKIPKTISLGVVNGRAIELVRPEYTKTARHFNLYGQVAVQVLIEANDGRVIFAKAVSGNPFLYASCIKAATESKFEPMFLGGEPVRVRGIIRYNFIPAEWNWLEIGYTLGDTNSTYYTFEILKRAFPDKHKEEVQLLKQIPEDTHTAKQTIIASVQNKLSNDSKSSWLFAIGLNLARSTSRWKAGGHLLDEKPESFRQLKFLTANSPSEIRRSVLSETHKYIDAIEQHKSYDAISTLRKLETNFPLLGR